MATVTNINDVLDGHVSLEVECVDRILLNVYVPNLQVGGQVVRFLCDHLGNPVPSPALFSRIGDRFRREVKAFADSNGIPVMNHPGFDAHSHNWEGGFYAKEVRQGHEGPGGPSGGRPR